MQRCRKLFAGGLAALMTVLLAPVMVLAAANCDSDCDGYHETYSEGHPVSLTIHLYEKNDTNGTNPGTGNEETTTGWLPIPNVEFTITQTHGADGNPVNPATAFTFTGKTGADGKLVVTQDDNGVPIPQGTFTVTETMPANADPTYEYATFTVQLPMTDPVTRSGWLYYVDVYPKNELAEDELEITKTLNGTEATVNNGDTFTWQIQSSIPTGVEESLYYLVADTLNANLKFTSIGKVSYYNGANEVLLTSGTHYDVLYISDFDPTSPDANGTPTNAAGGTVVIRLTEAGRKLLADAKTQAGNELPLLTIELTTQLALTEVNDIGHIQNTATLYYKNPQGEPGTGDPDPGDPPPSIITSAVRVHKVDPSNANLSGAIFVLRRLNSAGTGYEYYYFNETTGVTSWVDESSVADGYTNVTQVISGSDGFATFLGLADGSYEALEIVAPTAADGSQYNLLRDAITVVVDSEGKTSSTPADYIYTRKVENSLGFELPSTGGNGTLLLTIGGLGLMTIALVTFIIYRRRKAR